MTMGVGEGRPGGGGTGEGLGPTHDAVDGK